MSGSSGVEFSEDGIHDLGEPHKVQVYVANPSNTAKYGRIVQSFEEAVVDIVTWPQPGWRPIVPGTGNLGGLHECEFSIVWDAGVCTVHDSADDSQFHIARQAQDCDAIYVREAAYHPDSGQVIHPKDQHPYILLLAAPGEDIQLQDFRAFYFDGQTGFNISPGVWHLFPVPLPAYKTTVFNNKQGKVHAIIEVNTVKEFNKYLQLCLPAKSDTGV